MVGDEINRVQVTVPFQFFLVGREIPIVANLAISFEIDNLPEDEERLTDVATSMMLDELDSRSTHTLVLEDQDHNKVLIDRAAYQGMRVQIPHGYDPDKYRESEV
jgi:ligand-binding SRPBCC domain-containing protein